jgi:hypothetical protein
MRGRSKTWPIEPTSDTSGMEEYDKHSHRLLDEHAGCNRVGWFGERYKDALDV